jgi:hypothetical protein
MPTCSSDVHFTKTWIPTQPIHILVDYSNLLFNTKTIFLKNENPFYRPPCELLDSMKCLNGWYQPLKCSCVTKQITPKCGRDPN